MRRMNFLLIFYGSGSWFRNSRRELPETRISMYNGTGIKHMAIVITGAIRLEDAEIVLEFVRSSGPGGQNVNKVATAVKLYFDIGRSPSLPDEVRSRLRALAGRRVNSAGVLVIDARRFRSQEGNRRDAIERLSELIRQASVAPKPRRRTRPGAAAKTRRIEAKKRRGSSNEREGRVFQIQSEMHERDEGRVEKRNRSMNGIS